MLKKGYMSDPETTSAKKTEKTPRIDQKKSLTLKGEPDDISFQMVLPHKKRSYSEKRL